MFFVFCFFLGVTLRFLLFFVVSFGLFLLFLGGGGVFLKKKNFFLGIQIPSKKVGSWGVFRRFTFSKGSWIPRVLLFLFVSFGCFQAGEECFIVFFFWFLVRDL